MPAHHEVLEKDVNLKRLGMVLAVAYEKGLKDFADLLLLRNSDHVRCSRWHSLLRWSMAPQAVSTIRRDSHLPMEAKTVIHVPFL